MKKIFLVILCTVLSIGAASAQKPEKAPKYNATHDYGRNEIYFSYGASAIGSIISHYSGILDMVISEITDQECSIKSGGSKGVLNAGYYYSVNRTLSFGASVGFNRMSLKILEDGDIDTFGANLFTMMANMKVNWFQNTSFGMYSKLGLGAMCAAFGENDGVSSERIGSFWLPTGQLTMIGLEVGRQFRGFMEIGPGMQGWIQIGAKLYL
jgi:hypothetical protein